MKESILSRLRKKYQSGGIKPKYSHLNKEYFGTVGDTTSKDSLNYSRGFDLGMNTSKGDKTSASAMLNNVISAGKYEGRC